MSAAPESAQSRKERRDAALAALVAGVPYARFLGIAFERRGDELTALLPFQPALIGNPLIPALHGGATAAFLEVTAIIELAWSALIEDEAAIDPARCATGAALRHVGRRRVLFSGASGEGKWETGQRQGA